ncbi:allatostatin-A receptor-like [Oculina patagonica]
MNNTSFNAFLGQQTCSQIISATLTTSISFVSISAFVGNVLVTVIFLMNTTLRTSTNYFIVNMALSDLLSALTNWPLYATEGTLSRKPLINDPVATVVCKLGLYSRAVSQTVSVLSLVWIVLERFIAIVHPFKAMKMLTRRLRAVLLILTWSIPLLIASPYIGFSKIVKQGQQTYCRFSWGTMELSIYYPSGFVLLYCVPLVTIIILYTKIMKSLTRSRPAADEVQESARIRNRQQNMIVMKVFISIVIVFFLCWTPLCVFLVLKMVFPSLYAKDACLLYNGLFFYVFPSLAAAINPVILFVSSTNFYSALKETFNCFTWKSCCESRRVSPQTGVIELN